MQNEMDVDWPLCIADLMCGGLRASPGGRVERIVVAGGRAKGQGDGSWNYFDNVEVYNIAGNTWETGECHLMGRERAFRVSQ